MDKNNTLALAKLITQLESKNTSIRKKGNELLKKLIIKGQDQSILSKRIGFSGPPGVGKSTLIEKLGNFIVSQKLPLGILAVDPSSNYSGGSILGDKTRMQSLASNSLSYIRPIPSQGKLGGLGAMPLEIIQAMELYGYSNIFIETVGVGQAEIDLSYLADIMILLVNPKSGDDLQAMKCGLMEFADIIVIHKADLCSNEELAYLENMYGNENRPVISISSNDYQNSHAMILKLWSTINNFFKNTLSTKNLQIKRIEQQKKCIQREFQKLLIEKSQEFLWDDKDYDYLNNTTYENAITRLSKFIKLK